MKHLPLVLEDDFQSVLRSLSTLMFINISSHLMECESMLFVTNHILYLRSLSDSFSKSFIDFYSCEVVSSSDIRKYDAKSFASILEVRLEVVLKL